MDKDISYENKIIEKSLDVSYALKYYINRCKELERENKYLKLMKTE